MTICPVLWNIAKVFKACRLKIKADADAAAFICMILWVQEIAPDWDFTSAVTDLSHR